MILLLGCAPSTDWLVHIAPDASRTGADGALGPYGAAYVHRRFYARVTDRVDAEVMVPVDETGNPAVPDAPTLLLVQGGAVEVPRYRWLSSHFASRGYAVISPHHTLDLGILNVGNTEAVLEAAAADDFIGPWVQEQAFVMGHSLGGVLATWNWLDDEDLLGLVLIASFPAEGDDLSARAGSPVLVISGTADGKATADEVNAGFSRFEDPRWLAMVTDMNHYAWTDAASAAELAGDGPVGDTNTQRLQASAVLDAFVDGHLLGDEAAVARLGEPFAGVEVTP